MSKKRRKVPPKVTGSIVVLGMLAALAGGSLYYLSQTGGGSPDVAMPDPAPVEPAPPREPDPDIALPAPVPAPTPTPAPKPEPEISVPVTEPEETEAGVPPPPRPEPSEVTTPSQPDSTDTPKPDVAVSGWNYLPAGTSETGGYGLYSYLLIPVNDEASRPRYLAALGALRRHIDTVAAVEAAGFKKYEINITYLPVRGALSQDADVKLLLDNHDFARSKRILGHVGEEIGSGPYLVSYLEPLSGRPPSGSKLLVQDLSWVPPELAALWISNFTSEVKTPRSWNQTSLNDVMLVSRTFISVAAQSLDTGVEAVERFISLKKALAGQ